jgi:hypothetical protein
MGTFAFRIATQTVSLPFFLFRLEGASVEPHSVRGLSKNGVLPELVLGGVGGASGAEGVEGVGDVDGLDGRGIRDGRDSDGPDTREGLIGGRHTDPASSVSPSEFDPGSGEVEDERVEGWDE